MQDVLLETLEMLMLESLEGRCSEVAEMEHLCDLGFPDVVHYDKEMLQVVLHMEVALVKQNCKMHELTDCEKPKRDKLCPPLEAFI